MCVNITRNSRRVGEGDGRHCERCDLLKCFWNRRCELGRGAGFKVCLGALKANCVLSSPDPTLSSPRRLEDKMTEEEERRFYSEHTQRLIKKNRQKKTLKVVFHLAQGNECTFSTVWWGQAINFTWDTIYTMPNVCWTNLPHCAATMSLCKKLAAGWASTPEPTHLRWQPLCMTRPKASHCKNSHPTSWQDDGVRLYMEPNFASLVSDRKPLAAGNIQRAELNVILYIFKRRWKMEISAEIHL